MLPKVTYWMIYLRLFELRFRWFSRRYGWFAWFLGVVVLKA